MELGIPHQRTRQRICPNQDKSMPILVRPKRNNKNAQSDEKSGEPEKMYLHGDLTNFMSTVIIPATLTGCRSM
jgi:hypothetical protein